MATKKGKKKSGNAAKKVAAIFLALAVVTGATFACMEWATPENSKWKPSKWGQEQEQPLPPSDEGDVGDQSDTAVLSAQTFASDNERAADKQRIEGNLMNDGSLNSEFTDLLFGENTSMFIEAKTASLLTYGVPTPGVYLNVQGEDNYFSYLAHITKFSTYSIIAINEVQNGTGRAGLGYVGIRKFSNDELEQIAAEYKLTIPDLTDRRLSRVTFCGYQGSYSSDKQISYENPVYEFDDYVVFEFDNIWVIEDQHRPPYAVNVSTITYHYADMFPADPVKEGYTFLGWYYDEALTQPYGGEPIMEDITLYPKFEINRYTVTFNANGGTAVPAQTVDWNTSATVVDPVRTGYNFLGWYMKDGTKYEGQAVTSDITLTANWEIKRFTVTFMNENGSVYKQIEVNYGTSFYSAADKAYVPSSNLLSVQFAGEESAINKNVGDLLVLSDSTVTISEVSKLEVAGLWIKQHVWWVVGGAIGAFVLISVIAGVVSGKKKRG